MGHACKKCGDQKLIVRSANVFRHGLEALKSLVKVEVDYVCPGCGQKSGEERIISANEVYRTGMAERGATSTGKVKHHHATLTQTSSNHRRSTFVQFPAVFRVGENVLFPTFEGNVQDGTVIDQYGDPDLMLGFAEQYFKLYCSIMPTGRLPNSLIEMMPALHLLVIAAELALKAYLIRDDKVDFGHSLQQLYENLDPKHRNEIESRFAKSVLNTNLAALDVKRPSLESILRVYDKTYGGESKVYIDSRYYAEPTTTFKSSSGLHGANLVKGHNPYPVFFPEVVRALIDTYRFFSGHERLRRLGGDVQYSAREPGNDNHGDWGLVPSSLGLVVLSVPQPAGISAEGDKLQAFSKLLAENPPGFRTNWMYGGNTLLFYGAGEENHIDGHGMLNGVECRLWRHNRLGMHARDLSLLANALESEASLACLSDVHLSGNDKP